MAERESNVIKFPLDRVKATESNGKMGKVIPFPGNRRVANIDQWYKEKPRVKTKDLFEYLDVIIASDALFDDEQVMIDGMPLDEYTSFHERELLDYPPVVTSFHDATQVRVFEARLSCIGASMRGEEKKQACRDLAMDALDKADAMESADRLRDSVVQMLKMVYGSRRAVKMLERRELEKQTFQRPAHILKRKPHPHLKLIK